jgi:hypothetical protein
MYTLYYYWITSYFLYLSGVWFLTAHGRSVISVKIKKYRPIHHIAFRCRGIRVSLKSEGNKILVIIRLLKPHNIGTHLKGIETSFQMVPLYLKSFHFWASYITFWNVHKIPPVVKGLMEFIRSHMYIPSFYFAVVLDPPYVFDLCLSRPYGIERLSMKTISRPACLRCPESNDHTHYNRRNYLGDPIHNIEHYLAFLNLRQT